jgi:myo-inositol-hexaphosphate 3-phosphohydrolase
MLAVVSYSSAFAVVNSALYCASKFVKTIVCFGFAVSDNETVKNATNALTKKHPDNSYIAKIDDNSKLTVYDLNGNEVNLNGELLSAKCLPLYLTKMPSLL